ncbi:MAG TPA: filamentous hemagglutinin N-terminal domain-containing protein, partial [Candidatus Acidoferrum sp.]|nr:filamentous hemagglutinin N-terminal domain-containing protein [Candidatus Acidoferrum sp.]
MRIKIAVLGSFGLVSCIIPHHVLANPDGGLVVGGNASATIAGEGTSLVTINQNQSRSIINWNSFSINAGEITKFIQPSDTAAILNRVLSPNPSLIYGSLQANGRVFLVNPAGIMVGANGVVDTRGFLASTFDIGNDAFQAASKLTLAGPSTASVRNAGSIRALGGDVFLIANSVENSGTIQASGTVGLAAGSQIILAQAGAERVTVQAGNSTTPGQGTGVNNLGQIQAATTELKAAGGNMYALAINNGGAIRASSFVNEGGKIYLRASGGNIQNSGTLSASSASGRAGSVVVDGGHNAANPSTVINSGTIEAASASSQGGSVSLFSDLVGLVDHGRIDVSGEVGGGTALVGGDFRGANPAVQNAMRTYVGPDASIDASATDRGNGGKVIVWSDDGTRFFGSISARGGAHGGDGGFVETSGKDYLEVVGGRVDASSPLGRVGQWLMDPRNVTITNATTANGTFSAGSTNIFTPSANDAIVNNADINTALNGGTSVTITTGNPPPPTQQNGDIDVEAPISKTAGGLATLTLQANDLITVNSSISGSAGHPLNVDLEANNSIVMNANVSTFGGLFTANADVNANGTGTYSQTPSSAVNSAGGNVTIIATNIAISGPINAGSGTITLKPSTPESIGIGSSSATNGTVFGIFSDELTNLTAATLIIGDRTLNSSMVVNGVTNISFTNLTLRTFGTIDSGGSGDDITMNGGVLTLDAHGQIGSAAFGVAAAKLVIKTEAATFQIADSAKLTDLSITTSGFVTNQTLTSPNRTYSVAEAGGLTTLTNVTTDDGSALNFSYFNTGGGIQIGTLNTGSGNLLLSAAGAIGELPAGAITNSGLATFISTGSGSAGNITITNANNELNLVSASGLGVQISEADTAANDLTLTNVTAANLTIVAGGNVKQTGGTGIIVTNLLDVTAGGGANDITLANAGNELNLVRALGRNVQLTDADTFANDLTLTNLTAANLLVTAAGNVKQTGGNGITVSNLLQVTAGAGAKDITLTNAGNELNLASVLGRAVKLNDADTFANDLTLTNVTASSLTVTAGGNVTQTAGTGIIVTNLLDVTAGAGVKDITLANAGNELNLVRAQGRNVQLADADTFGNDLTLTNVTAANLIVTAGGNVNQTGGTGIVVSNLLDVLAGAGSKDITLTNAANELSLASALGRNVKLEDADTFADDLTLTNLTALNLTVASAGNLKQTGGNGISVSGLADLTAGAGTKDILLANPNNELNWVKASGKTVQFADADTAHNGLTLTNVVATNLTATTLGNLAVSNTVVSLDASLVAGTNLTLTSVTIGGSGSVTNGGAATLSLITVGTNLLVQSGGNVTQSGAIRVSNNLEIVTTGSGVDVLLGNATNFIAQGLLVTNSSGFVHDLALANSVSGAFTNLSFPTTLSNLTLTFPNSAITLGGVTVASNLSVLAGGDITQSNAVKVGGTATFNSSTNFNVTLSDPNNNFNVASLTASNATINDVDAIKLGASLVRSNLQITAGGNISETGALTVGGSSLFDLTANGASLLLGSQPNNFGGPVTVVGLLDTLDLRNIAANASAPAGFASATNVILTFDNSGLTFGNTVIQSNLTVTAGGNIGQTNGTSLVVGGKAAFAATNFNITLTNAGNDFNVVSLVSSNAAIADINTLTLDAPTFVTSNLTVSTVGDLSQNGAVTIGGLTTLLATNATINLGNGGNDFRTVSLVASNATLADVNTLDLGTTVVANNLNASAGTDLTQSGVVTVGGLATLSANRNIALANPNNDFNTVSLSASNATVADINTIGLGATAITSNLTIIAGANITNSGPVLVGGLATLLATNGDIDLSIPFTNDFNSVLLVANNVRLWDLTGINLASALVSTDLVVIAGGDITQTGPLTVGGLSGFGLTRDGSSVLLGNQPNNLGGLVELATISTNVNVHDFQLRNISTNAGLPLFFAGFSVTNVTFKYDNAGLVFGSPFAVISNLTAIVGGDIGQSNAAFVTVGGVTTLWATNHNITLNSVSNDFNTVSLVGNNAVLTDLTGIDFAASSLAGVLNVTAGGAISQSGPLFVGASSIFSSPGNITLANPANDFVSQVVIVNGQAVNLVDVNSLTVNGSSASLSAHANGGDLTLAGYTTTGALTAQASGNIFQTGTLLVGTTSSLNAGGNITLNNPANDFVGAVTVVNGQAVNLADVNTLTVGGTSASLAARAFAGDLILAGYTTTGALTAQASGNIFQTGTLLVGTTSSLNAGGNITLNNPANDFVGAVTVVNGQAVNLADVNTLTVGGTSASLAARAFAGDLTLAGYTTTGTLTAQASGNIFQTGTLLVGTTSSLNAGGNITLNNPANDFVGAVTVVNGQVVNLADVNTLTVGGTSASLAARAFAGDLILAGYTTTGALTAQASGNIFQTGTLLVGTTSSLNAGGNIT